MCLQLSFNLLGATGCPGGLWLCRLLAGYAYPAYQTFKALEMKGSDDVRKWAKYWIILGLYNAAAPAVELFLFWLPFFYEARLAGAIYLWSNGARRAAPRRAGCLQGSATQTYRPPCSEHATGTAGAPLPPKRHAQLIASPVAGLKGADEVYSRWVQPLVLQYEPLIDSKISAARAQAGDLLSSNAARLVALVQEKVAALLQTATLKVRAAGRGGAGCRGGLAGWAAGEGGARAVGRHAL